MSGRQSKKQKLAWANAELGQFLDEIGETFPGMPQRTVIIRDASKPERYMLLTNESDAFADALHALCKNLSALGAPRVGAGTSERSVVRVVLPNALTSKDVLDTEEAICAALYSAGIDAIVICNSEDVARTPGEEKPDARI